jgi:hypothetical protein
MHKIVHILAIATPRTPIFNNFSFNVELYVNTMYIVNNKFHPDI